MPFWPLTLPRCPVRDGTPRRPRTNVVSFSPTYGEPMARRASTAVVHELPRTFKLSADQRDVFLDWFHGELADGSLAFDWTDPDLGDDASFMFDPEANPPYSLSRLGAYWLLSATLLRLP